MDCDHDWRTVTIVRTVRPDLTSWKLQECTECGKCRKEPVVWVEDE